MAAVIHFLDVSDSLSMEGEPRIDLVKFVTFYKDYCSFAHTLCDLFYHYQPYKD
jgi:hypothetical protein